jgi:hypothetical protein
MKIDLFILLVVLLNTLSLFSVFTGLHDIDNAWNMQRIGGMIDCNLFTCQNPSNLYNIGIMLIFGGITISIISVALLLATRQST